MTPILVNRRKYDMIGKERGKRLHEKNLACYGGWAANAITLKLILNLVE